MRLAEQPRRDVSDTARYKGSHGLHRDCERHVDASLSNLHSQYSGCSGEYDCPMSSLKKAHPDEASNRSASEMLASERSASGTAGHKRQRKGNKGRQGPQLDGGRARLDK